MDGSVAPGTVVAIFPGLTYSCTQYNRMPNFPRIDTNNPYLSRRFDMDIVDSKPWGLGALQPGQEGRWQACGRRAEGACCEGRAVAAHWTEVEHGLHWDTFGNSAIVKQQG